MLKNNFNKARVTKLTYSAPEQRKINSTPLLHIRFRPPFGINLNLEINWEKNVDL